MYDILYYRHDASRPQAINLQWSLNTSTVAISQPYLPWHQCDLLKINHKVTGDNNLQYAYILR